MVSSMTKTATTTRFVLIHEGEGGSVSEWEWGWGWDVSVWTWFVTLRVLVELIKERPWTAGECLLGSVVQRAWTYDERQRWRPWLVWLCEVWDWEWVRPCAMLEWLWLSVLLWGSKGEKAWAEMREWGEEAWAEKWGS